MKTALLINLFLVAASSMLVTSCATFTGNAPSGMTKTAGDAAVDAATKNTDPLTKAAIRNTTGYGTDPIEKAKTDTLNKLGF